MTIVVQGLRLLHHPIVFHTKIHKDNVMVCLLEDSLEVRNTGFNKLTNRMEERT